MTEAVHGSAVTISYVGTLDNGRIFHSTDSSGPQTYTIGSGELFPGLERAITGMRAGEVKNILLPAHEAYGPRLQENIIKVPRQVFPAGKEITTGQKLGIQFSGGVSRSVIVIAVGDAEVTVDGNHPLAGQDLTFALKVERVERPGE